MVLGLSLSRGKEVKETEETEETQVPEEFIDYLAQRVFEKYGEALARMINERVAPRLDRLERQIETVDRKVKELEAASGNKALELIKTVLQIHSEALVDNAVGKAVSKVVDEIQDTVAFDKVLSIEDKLSTFSEKLVIFEEVVENIQYTTGKLEKMLTTSQRDLGGVLKEIKNVKNVLDNVVVEFRKAVEDTTNEAVEVIKQNVTVDPSVIKQAVESATSQVAMTKMSEVLNSINEMTSSILAEISNLRRELDVLRSAVDEIYDRIEEISKETPSRSEEEENEEEKERIDELIK